MNKQTLKHWLLASILLLSALAPLGAIEMKDGYFIDKEGNKVEAKEYKKIVLIDPAVVEVIYMLGGEANIAAIAHTKMSPIYPADKTAKLKSVGSLMKPSLEMTSMYHPDLVVLNPMATAFGESLKAQHIPFLVNETTTLQGIIDSIRIYGIMVGKEAKASVLARKYKAKLDKVSADIRDKPLRLKGVFLFATHPMMVFNSHSLPGEVLKKLGVDNIAGDLKGARPIISPEFLLAANPDFIIGAMAIASPQDIKDATPVVGQTKAGKNNAIFIIPSEEILRPTPRVIDTLEELYKRLARLK